MRVSSYFISVALLLAGCSHSLPLDVLNGLTGSGQGAPLINVEGVSATLSEIGLNDNDGLSILRRRQPLLDNFGGLLDDVQALPLIGAPSGIIPGLMPVTEHLSTHGPAYSGRIHKRDSQEIGVPGLSQLPSLPGMSSLSSVPGLSSLPSMDSIPGLSSLNSVPGLSSLSSLASQNSFLQKRDSSVPGAGSLPGLTSLSSLPGLSSMGSLPGLSSMSSLPGLGSMGSLPGLPSMSSLPGLGSMGSLPGLSGLSSLPGMGSML